MLNHCKALLLAVLLKGSDVGRRVRLAPYRAAHLQGCVQFLLMVAFIDGLVQACMEAHPGSVEAAIEAA